MPPALPAVEPAPPRAPGPWPWLGAGAALLRGPSEFFAEQRARLGDTYLVDAFGYRLFCVFSAAGVQRLYALPEDEASFGLATYELVMRRKLPAELVVGRRNRPHDFFGRDDVEDYLEQLEEAVGLELAELGASGRFEAFAWARRLGHRLGLAAWAGREAAAAPHLDPLVRAFDALDQGASFVRPASILWTAATGKRRERRAMGRIEAILAAVLAGRRRSGAAPGDILQRIEGSFAELPEAERAVQVARDVMLFHMGAQSNLHAALAWTLVDLLLRPALRARVEAGDDALLESCANESIRLAQRSLTLRRVMKPIEVDTGAGVYRLAPGVMLATMLSVNNPRAAPGLDRYDPEHYAGRRLAGGVPLAARELVSTFGHGRHSCPAQRFSITAIRIALRRLLGRFELAPGFQRAEPLRRQLGGVARAARPCPVSYRARAGA